jgi:penicillin-binding protein 2
MSFHPNDVARRARAATFIITAAIVVLVGAFFKTQVLQHARYALQSEQNRLRPVPLPAPRGIIYDRDGRIIAENVPGYSVSLFAQSSDSLRATLVRLSSTIQLTDAQIESAVRRYRLAPTRPTVIIADARFDIVAVLEELRMSFPGLVIQSAPKRYYPDSTAVSAFVGYTSEISEQQLALAQYSEYKSGQQVGVSGLERQYEESLRGREGTRFVEVDAHNRIVREAGARQDIPVEAAPALITNIDMELQRFVADSVFPPGTQGGFIAMDPRTGEVLAIHSAPGYNPNLFIGGIGVEEYRQLNTDPARPLYNKALQGLYPPASTWKLATAIIALEEGVVGINDRMPTPCNGSYYWGGRYWRCWKPEGHGAATLATAIEGSCNVYFYQLGLRINVDRLLAGGVRMQFREKTGIDLPEERTPIFPASRAYYDERFGPRGWTNAVSLNLAIGQGEATQTVLNMARFYSALATDGRAARPSIVQKRPERDQLFTLTDQQMQGIREALAGVVSWRGTAGSAQIPGMVLAGKTGTAQNPGRASHAWFVGFAPADDPEILVSVMVEFGESGGVAARAARKAVEFYLQRRTVQLITTDG